MAHLLLSVMYNPRWKKTASWKPKDPRKSWRHQPQRPFVRSPQIDMVADAWDAGALGVSCWGEAARELCRHLRVELCSAVVGVPKKHVKIHRLQYVGVMVVSEWDRERFIWRMLERCLRCARPSTGVPSCLHLICCLTSRLGEQSSRVPTNRIDWSTMSFWVFVGTSPFVDTSAF